MALRDDPNEELVRQNLKSIREAAGYSQPQASVLSGLALDNIRRWEGGVAGISAVNLKALAEVYGCGVEAFHMKDPPKPHPENSPPLFLRARPGVDIDHEVYAKIKAQLDKANQEILAAQRKAKRKKKG